MISILHTLVLIIQPHPRNWVDTSIPGHLQGLFTLAPEVSLTLLKLPCFTEDLNPNVQKGQRESAPEKINVAMDGRETRGRFLPKHENSIL